MSSVYVTLHHNLQAVVDNTFECFRLSNTKNKGVHIWESDKHSEQTEGVGIIDFVD